MVYAIIMLPPWPAEPAVQRFLADDRYALATAINVPFVPPYYMVPKR